MNKALVIIDMQNDFIPGGSLAVSGGDEIISVINDLIPNYPIVVATQDWHPANHLSFGSQHPNHKIFDTIDLNGIEQVLWPNHCVQGTNGAEFHSKLDLDSTQAIFRKGMHREIDSYSAFYDNNHLNSTGLTGFLKEKEVEEIHFCGLAADYCVYFSMKDALQEGFNVVLLENATRAIDYKQFEKQKAELLKINNFRIKN